MNWKDDPATECQLNHLRQLGYQTARRLTKGEAARLISRYETSQGGSVTTLTSTWAKEALGEKGKGGEHYLRREVDCARRAVLEAVAGEMEQCQRKLEKALEQRQAFWADTFLGVAHVPGMSEEVHALYIEHGCRFVQATSQQIQEILNALDGAMALWDMEHPEIFFQTLELNFPELRRHTP